MPASAGIFIRGVEAFEQQALSALRTILMGVY